MRDSKSEDPFFTINESNGGSARRRINETRVQGDVAGGTEQ